MPRVLTTNAQILCPHTGVGTSTASHPKWFIDNGSSNGIVLVENDMGTIKGCKLTQAPCLTYQLNSMGLNATEVDGKRVILETDFNKTNTGFPLLIQEFHQVFDNSTTAPLPPGQTSQPLPANLADLAKPAVGILQGQPKALGFDLATQTPPSVMTAFTLFSDHPLKWILTLLNELDGSSSDISNGLPPGLAVIPPGGSWDTSFLVVTVTMTIPYLASLKPGVYHFVMTAVSQRGLSDFIDVMLTVS